MQVWSHYQHDVMPQPHFAGLTSVLWVVVWCWSPTFSCPTCNGFTLYFYTYHFSSCYLLLNGYNCATCVCLRPYYSYIFSPHNMLDLTDEPGCTEWNHSRYGLTTSATYDFDVTKRLKYTPMFRTSQGRSWRLVHEQDVLPAA